MKKYAEATLELNHEKYKEAKENYQLLLPYQEDIFSILNLDIQNQINECNYQIALTYYYAGDYATAKDLFRNIHTYADSTEYYYKCGYKIADEYYENNNLVMALRYFYQVRNFTEADVSDRIEELESLLYQNAGKFYDNKDYESALEIYKVLSKFGYSDSTSMITQCSYRYALNLFESKKYQEAKNIFDTIKTYKDSYALAKQCTYNISSILFENNPVMSISSYHSIRGFKNVDTILNSENLMLYGVWEIDRINNAKVTPVEFSFDDNGYFEVQTQISDVAISTPANKLQYLWDDETEMYVCKNYTIDLDWNLDEKILTLSCSNGTTTTTYTCKRIEELEKLLQSKSTVNTEDKTKTKQEIFEELIAEYVGKKTDGNVYINGKEVNILK